LAAAAELTPPHTAMTDGLGNGTSIRVSGRGSTGVRIVGYIARGLGPRRDGRNNTEIPGARPPWPGSVGGTIWPVRPTRKRRWRSWAVGPRDQPDQGQARAERLTGGAHARSKRLSFGPHMSARAGTQGLGWRAGEVEMGQK
jgi:hypothetical protein